MNDPRQPWDPGSGEPVPPSYPNQSNSPQSGYRQPAHQPPNYEPAPHQPPSYQQPGAPFGQPPAERTKRKIWPWLLGLFTFFVLAIGGCSFVAYRAFTGPIDQANEFLAALAERDFPTAAAMASDAATCFDGDPEQVIQGAFAGVAIDKYNLNGVEMSSADNATRARTSGTIDIAGMPTQPVEVNLIKEGGEWMVCGLWIDP